MTYSRFSLFTLLSFLFCFTPLSAQLSQGGQPYSFLQGQSLKADIPRVDMPRVDAHALLAEDETENEKGKPYLFGYAHDVSLNLKHAGRW